MNLEGQYLTIELAYSLFFLSSLLIIIGSLIRKRTKKQLIQGLFLAYYIQIAYFTLFSNPIYIALNQRATESVTAIFGLHPFLFKNLVPFSSIADQVFWHYWDISMGLNVVMTIPLGMLFVMKWQHEQRRFRWRKLLGLGLLFSMTIECSQLILNIILGYRYRIVTSDDVLMNLLGVLFGAIIVKIIYWLWEKVMNNKRRK